MARRMASIAVIVITVGVFLSSLALAGNGKQKGKKTSATTTEWVCPNGNTPQSDGAQGKGKGYGPCDGTGNGGNSPQDGTGYGRGSKSDSTRTGICDGTGAKGNKASGLNTGTRQKINPSHRLPRHCSRQVRVSTVLN